jgi:hypothetical protein
MKCHFCNKSVNKNKEHTIVTEYEMENSTLLVTRKNFHGDCFKLYNYHNILDPIFNEGEFDIDIKKIKTTRL